MTTSFSFTFMTGLFQETAFAAFFQELLVMGVFAVSFLAWRHLGQRPRVPRGPKLVTRDGDSVVAAPAKKNSPRSKPAVGELGSALAQPQVKVAEEQMLRHLEQREFTRALNVYRTFERVGREKQFSEELFSAFIQSAVRVGKIDVAERMLRTIKRGGLEPSLKFWQTTLKMLSSRKHFAACVSVYTIFGRQVPTDKVVFSCLINAALELTTPDKAVEMLQRYGESDIDAKDYVLFFRTYVAIGDVDSAEAIFQKLKDETTTLMLNLLLLTAVNAKQPDRALGILKEAHRLEKGKRGLEKIVDVVSYNTVIKGYSQANMAEKCFRCLHEMLNEGLEPDDITFGTLLDSCIAGKNIGAASEIVDLIMGRAKQLDTVMCTLFLKGLVQANCLPKAMELYEEMKRRESARPDIVTYSVLIKALVDQHELQRALKLVEDMQACGQNPDDIILTHLLEGCRHAGNHSLGKKLFTDMLAAGVTPSEYTLITMLKLHGRCGAHKEAHDLVANWQAKYGLKPSVIHYTCLMSGCLRTKSYDQAWSAYELMCSSGITPDETAISTLLPGMVAAQQWDRAFSLAKQALSNAKPLPVPAETLNNALMQMRAAAIAAPASELHSKAEELQDLMRAAGVVVTMRSSKRFG